MNHERIFYGTTGFVVEKIDETTGEELLTYLDDEGFDATKGIDLPKNAFIHVNTQSMCYGQGIHGIKIASDTYGEVPNRPFTINEFKTIWHVLKKHKAKKKRAKIRDRKYLESGYACFLIKEDCLKDAGNDFWRYLEREKFKALTEKDTPPEWVLINIGNSTYINYSDNEEIISYVKENYENALNTSEFKRIWEVIRKHRL